MLVSMPRSSGRGRGIFQHCQREFPSRAYSVSSRSNDILLRKSTSPPRLIDGLCQALGENHVQSGIGIFVEIAKNGLNLRFRWEQPIRTPFRSISIRPSESVGQDVSANAATWSVRDRRVIITDAESPLANISAAFSFMRMR